MPALEFFYDFGSPYSYLASTQVEALVARTGATHSWRPMLLGGVFKATGNETPASNMYKARYLFGDLQSWARHYDLPKVVLPRSFPTDSLKADRLALVAEEQGKLVQWTHGAFARAFVLGDDLADAEVLTDLLRQVGMDPQASFARMLSPEIKERLRRTTEEAVDRGVFGAPTFFVNGQMFFGNDRLHFVERALAQKEA